MEFKFVFINSQKKKKKGLKSSRIKPWIIIAVIVVRYGILPAIGLWVVKAAGKLGFLSSDPLYYYVLMIQYTLPPAMNIGKDLSHKKKTSMHEK